MHVCVCVCGERNRERDYKKLAHIIVKLCENWLTKLKIHKVSSQRGKTQAEMVVFRQSGREDQEYGGTL